MTAVALLLALAVGPQAADTVLAMNRGERVVIEGLSGVIVISAWERDELEVRGAAGNSPVGARRTGTTVRIEPEAPRPRAPGSPEPPRPPRRRRSVDAAIRVPSWVEVEVGGSALDISVRGVNGAIRVASVSGDVFIENVGGPVDVRSIRGEIQIVDARGGVRASSQADDVTLRRISGPVEAHSGDGDIILDAIESVSVRAEAQDGDVFFSGTIDRAGEYGFYLHDGDATVEVPASVAATVSISTFDGEFLSDFPVRVERFSAGREFDFVLGAGGARIEIEVFDGEIRLLQRR